MPSAHIIIVNYNSGDWLTRALSSVCLASKAPDSLDLKVTVVDNASTDDSMGLAQRQLESSPTDCEALEINWVFNAQNLGFAAANNQILRQLDTDFAVLMNPDCELQADTLAIIYKAFESNPGFAMASCRILNEDNSLQATCRRRFPTPWSALVRMLQLNKLFPNHSAFADFDYGDDVDSTDQPHSVEAISGAFMVVKREALRQIGLLDEGYFMHCEDLDWCKRAELAGLQVGFVPAAQVLHAKGVSSKSRPIGVLWTLHKGMNRFFDKFYQRSYSLPVRLSVKLGIYLSFIARAGLAGLKSVLSK